MPMKGQAVVLAILNIPYTVKLFIEGELSVGTATKSMKHLFQGGVIKPKEDVSVFYEELICRSLAQQLFDDKNNLLVLSAVV